MLDANFQTRLSKGGFSRFLLEIINNYSPVFNLKIFALLYGPSFSDSNFDGLTEHLVVGSSLLKIQEIASTLI
ncbi:hypothetical protein CWI38_0707p0010 [Hamiltosporidium tvaerminnensis]|uniref:Uncharacterized protein n=1 Tax=Hamiltosporidium tvaerminnensis TaxID=1176355 RepID=A0A4Q9LXW9_9MICR|nr:hypothetical protein CWI38_0707p0010 [Hamiltosporidium tvaerminnensis]